MSTIDEPASSEAIAASAETPEEREDLDPLKIAQQQFQRAHEHLGGLKRGVIDFFQLPKRTLTICFPIEMEDGSVQTFHGYRVLHNRVLGPGKGGIRYHPDVAVDEVAALAAPKAVWFATLRAWAPPSSGISPGASSMNWGTISGRTPTFRRQTGIPTRIPWPGSMTPTISFFAAERFLQIAPLPGLDEIEGAGIAIQGMGQVGSVVARAFRDAGASIGGL